MKKFEEVATLEGTEKWGNSIKREKELYKPIYGLENIRNEFDRDYTRVLNSYAYRRLKHKTQVFYAPQNDHICTRIEHVNLVESVSHTISNFLGLNNDLTKAIAISHDIGHSPFGHQGEKILSDITIREYGEKFWHEKNGLHFVDNIELISDYEGKQRNLDLTYAVRDGIISHCGEVDENGIKPRNECISLSDYKEPNQYAPYTWEACSVKVADKIAYIGRDIEDAKHMNLLNEKDINKLDKIIQKIRIGNSNIINYLITDLCKNSTIEGGLKFSEEAINIMNRIKKFNYEKIYLNEKMAPSTRYFKIVINEVYYTLKNEFDEKNTIRNLKKLKRYYPNLSEEFVKWLSNYAETEDRIEENYNNKIIYDLTNLRDYEKSIIDYISGMTDQYIISVYNEIVSF